MSLEEKIALERKDAKDEGKREEREDNIQAIMEALGCTQEHARKIIERKIKPDTGMSGSNLHTLDL